MFECPRRSIIQGGSTRMNAVSHSENRMIPNDDSSHEVINLSSDEMYALYEYIDENGPISVKELADNFCLTIENLRYPLRRLVELKVVNRTDNLIPGGDMRFTRYSENPQKKVRRVQL
ncbi:MAG: hypothetical protein ACTSYA_01765 [Candidatus Kariarchaeaceae archaeon]